jgi:L,D-transpeptidase ErfK/SrfK
VVRANKKVDRWLPGDGKEVLIPSRYVLPDAPRQGIVINLPEYRLYYYPPVPANQPRKVISYAVGIGRVDWKTPLGLTTVVGKVKNPTWTPPASIKEEHRLNGDILPEVWPAGPDNPLGLFAFRLGIPGYLLHSTNKPQGVGMQVSHGCMRLYPKDIEQLFSIVNVGTQVNIINQPVKVGWSNGSLYIESHPTLEGEEISFEQRLTLALGLIEKALTQHLVTINSEALKVALEASNGLPALISTNEPPVDVFATPAAIPNPALPDPPVPALDLSLPAEVVPVPEIPVLPAVVTPTPVVKPAKPVANRPVAPKKVVPKSAIDAELQREEQQERTFKTSPFPH